ncbi:MAG TPA: helix-turn-helix domain-containing protein [Kofleriaceae bacterium]|nr:helix-turn-helix domain-containing protein [Kofleriaceae bacterium]
MAKAPVRSIQHRLGERIQALRAERELTQEALAARIGISQKYLSELERGAKAPSWQTLVSVAHKGFEMKLSVLLFGVDEEVSTEVKHLNDVLAGRSKEVRYDVVRAVELILRAAEASK